MSPKDSTLPIDPNVKVPDAVKRAAARADAHHKFNLLHRFKFNR